MERNVYGLVGPCIRGRPADLVGPTGEIGAMRAKLKAAARETADRRTSCHRRMMSLFALNLCSVDDLTFAPTPLLRLPSGSARAAGSLSARRCATK